MQSNLRKTVAILPLLLLILTLGLAACGGASTNVNAPANEVDMGPANFVQTSRAISTGQSIHFVDQQSGTTHMLCIGRDGSCDTSAKAPKDLASPGFSIQPGQTHDVLFDTAGTYTITCPIHPSMNLTITVR